MKAHVVLAAAVLLAAPGTARAHAETVTDPDEPHVADRFDVAWAAVDHPVSVSGRLVRHTIRMRGTYGLSRPTLVVRVRREQNPRKFRYHRFHGTLVATPDGPLPIGRAEWPSGDPHTVAYTFGLDQIGDPGGYAWRVESVIGDRLPDEGWIEHRLPVLARTAAKPGPPTRLWYRVSATVEQTRVGGSFEPRGDDPVVEVQQHHHARVAYRLQSRHAVLLYRQCTPLASDVDPKLLARYVAVRSTTTCAELRRYARDTLRMRPREIRAQRLVDDVRFTARAAGTLDAHEQATEVAAHTYRLAGRPGAYSCPAQTHAIRRFTELPLEVGGAIRTAAAARDGVSADLGLPRRLVAVETGSSGGPCIHDLTGRSVLETRLVQGHGSSLSLHDATAYGRFPTSPVLRFRIGRRFGRAFTVSASRTLTEPVSNMRQTGPWTTTVTTTLRFDPCPRGGRGIDRC